RFYRLNSLPAEMTSDHVEKLLDSYDVSQGIYHIFFTRNGGREAIQFYFVPLIASLFGTGMSFLSLKLASVLEAVALIPLIIAFGREMVDRETGFYTAALLAISWWHISLSRLALRIVLTPLIFTALLIVLARGIRTGKRKAWVWAGIWMGIGVYAYQALRAAPLVAIAAFAAAVAGPIYRAVRTGAGAEQETAHNQLIASNAVSRQALNLACAGLISIAIFVPMLRVWHDFPEQLWMRVVNRTTNSEVAISGNPGHIFVDNLKDALLMFNKQGDVAWISAVPGEPTMDIITGGLLVLGLVAWVARIRARRDPADGFILLAGLIMLLPSALAIAFPIENPSITRSSGVIPIVFLLAAWPLSLIRQRWKMVFGHKTGLALAAPLLLALVVSAALINYDIYFNDFSVSYQQSALNPGEVAEAVRGVIGEDGTLEGVWLQGWPYWHDYRAIGIEAGDITFHNAILDVPMLLTLINDTPEQFATRPLVFIIHPDDSEARTVLGSYFPHGESVLYPSEIPGKEFYLFVVEGQ
nr:glycosyltransferase family 39 protein [Anaerolineae bacterium]